MVMLPFAWAHRPVGRAVLFSYHNLYSVGRTSLLGSPFCEQDQKKHFHVGSELDPNLLRSVSSFGYPFYLLNLTARPLAFCPSSFLREREINFLKEHDSLNLTGDFFRPQLSENTMVAPSLILPRCADSPGIVLGRFLNDPGLMRSLPVLVFVEIPGRVSDLWVLGKERRRKLLMATVKGSFPASNPFWYPNFEGITHSLVDSSNPRVLTLVDKMDVQYLA